MSTGYKPPPREPVSTVTDVLSHKHRCMRCGEEFDCRTPAVCKAGYDVLPSIVTPGPNGPIVTEHCPRPGVVG